jgi:hypothetical protein
LVRQKNGWTQSSETLEQVLHSVVGAERARASRGDPGFVSRAE